MSFPINALNESQTQTTFLWKLAIEENQTKSENAPVLTVRGYSKMDWDFGRARGTKKMCQIIKNLLNWNLSLSASCINWNFIFSKGTFPLQVCGLPCCSSPRGARLLLHQTKLPRKVLKNRTIKTNAYKNKTKKYRLEKRKYLAAKSSIQDTDEEEIKRTCFCVNTDIKDNFSRRWITS